MIVVAVRVVIVTGIVVAAVLRKSTLAGSLTIGQARLLAVQVCASAPGADTDLSTVGAVLRWRHGSGTSTTYTPPMNVSQETVRKHRLSVTDYRRMGEAGILAPDARVELIDGEIIDMPPIGPTHASIVDRLTERFVLAAGGRAIVRVQSPIELSDFSQPEPDIALLVPRADFYAAALPRPSELLLVIEVADTTLRHDRDTKLPLYARHGVPEAWLIDMQGAKVTLHREPDEHGFGYGETLGDLRAVSPLRLDGVQVDLSDLF